jgi:N-glycosylase/DNA lyase
MSLINKINNLKKTEVKQIVDNRIKEFESILIKKDQNKIFSELCFCILTANSTAELCVKVQKNTEKYFLILKEEELAEKLKENSCRFHTKRAGYICEARKKKEELLNILITKEQREIRNWIAENIKGLGMKESSHFLRNIGFKDVAIIDFHILDLLEKENLIKKPKKLDKETYLKLEQVLEKLAKKVNLNLSELDLYLWYIETGKVLK